MEEYWLHFTHAILQTVPFLSFQNTTHFWFPSFLTGSTFRSLCYQLFFSQRLQVEVPRAQYLVLSTWSYTQSLRIFSSHISFKWFVYLKLNFYLPVHSLCNCLYNISIYLSNKYFELNMFNWILTLSPPISCSHSLTAFQSPTKLQRLSPSHTHTASPPPRPPGPLYWQFLLPGILVPWMFKRLFLSPSFKSLPKCQLSESYPLHCI